MSVERLLLSLRRAYILLIRLYQRLLSPDHSFWSSHAYPAGFCRYTPTCSDYTVQAIESRGIIRGTLKGIWRICRCNPWSTGGIDRPE